MGKGALVNLIDSGSIRPYSPDFLMMPTHSLSNLAMEATGYQLGLRRYRTRIRSWSSWHKNNGTGEWNELTEVTCAGHRANGRVLRFEQDYENAR